MRLWRRVTSQIILFAIVLAAMFLVAARSKDVDETMCELLRQKLERMNSAAPATITGERLESLTRVTQFYKKRSYRPAWSHEGLPLPQADSLITAIRNAYREGLEPRDYHLIRLEDALSDACRTGNEQDFRYVSSLVEMDCLFTDMMLTYASHLLVGHTNPPEGLKHHLACESRIDLAMLVDSAVGRNCISSTLRKLLPIHSDYWRLRNALASYRRIAQAGGWTHISPGLPLRVGVVDKRVQLVRNRLSAELSPTQIVIVQSDTFDRDLSTVVKKFQQLHGLGEDGIVDGVTRAALNIPVEGRIHQIEINMERWRWLQREPHERCIIVNIANFDLHVIENDRAVLSMKVIVGKSLKPTPIFAGMMTHVIINPSWNVPSEIALNEIVPAIGRNAQYLAREHFSVYSVGRGRERELDPTVIDWKTANVETLRFQQRPGSFNALGRLQFYFPNKFGVYIHGTRAQSLFGKSVRDFSHGCIRIEHPLELAKYVLRDDSSWTPRRLAATIEMGINYPVKLPKPIPVYVLYLTAWMENSGNVQFRDDIYALDQVHNRELVSELKVMKESRTIASSIRQEGSLERTRPALEGRGKAGEMKDDRLARGTE